MSEPQIRPQYTFSSAIFLYKPTNEGGWIRLPCSEYHSKYNCCSIRFDDFGVRVTQKNTKHEIVCHLKLVLKSPIITTENNQLIVEAACVGIRSLDLVPFRSSKDSAHALEHLGTLPLALIRDAIVAVTLYDLTGTREGTEMLEQQELMQLIPSLVEKGFRSHSARHTNGSSGSTIQPEIPNITVPEPRATETPSTRHRNGSSGSTIQPEIRNATVSNTGQNMTPGTRQTNGSLESTTQIEIRSATVSNTGQTMTPNTRHTNGSSESASQPETRNATVPNTGQPITPRTVIPRTGHPRGLYNPNAQPYQPSSPSTDSHDPAPVASNPTLEQRLEAHHFEAARTESWLVQRLEGDRCAMLDGVMGPVAEAINLAFDRVVGEAVREHWVRADAVARIVVGGYEWVGG